jgi:hypothetical protein
MIADPFQTDDAANPDEVAARRFAAAAFAALESRERIELPGTTLVRVAGGFKIATHGPRETDQRDGSI